MDATKNKIFWDRVVQHDPVVNIEVYYLYYERHDDTVD